MAAAVVVLTLILASQAADARLFLHLGSFQGLNGADNVAGSVYGGGDDATLLIEGFNLESELISEGSKAMFEASFPAGSVRFNMAGSRYNVTVPSGDIEGVVILVRVGGIPLAFVVLSTGRCQQAGLWRVGRLTPRIEEVRGTVLAKGSKLFLRDFRPPSNFSFSESHFFKAGLSGEFLFSGRRLTVSDGGSPGDIELVLPLETFSSLGQVSWLSLWDAKWRRSLADIFFGEEVAEMENIITDEKEDCDSLDEILLGSLQTLQHDVSGSVFRIGRSALIVKNFSYDGAGHEAKFILGVTNTSSASVSLYPLSPTGLQPMKSIDLILPLPPQLPSIMELSWLSVRSEPFKSVFGYLDLSGGRNELPVLPLFVPKEEEKVVELFVPKDSTFMSTAVTSVFKLLTKNFTSQLEKENEEEKTEKEKVKLVTAPSFFSPPPMVELEAAVTLNEKESTMTTTTTTTQEMPKQKLEQKVGLKTGLDEAEDEKNEKVKMSGRTEEKKEDGKNEASHLEKSLFLIIAIMMQIM